MIRFETKRCIIRPFLEKDLEFFMKYRNDEKWMIYQGFKGLSKEEYRKILLKENTVEDGLQLAIISKFSDKIIGDLYVKKGENEFYIGYTISPIYSRQSYTYEATSGLIEWIKQSDLKKICGSVSSDNHASIHLLKKLGFTYVKTNEDEEDEYILKI